MDHKEEFLDVERLAQEETSVETHALEFPVVATGNDDDGDVPGASMTAQHFVERDTIKVGQADVQEDEVGIEDGQVTPGMLAVGKEVQVERACAFEHIAKEVGEFGVVFDNSDDFVFLAMNSHVLLLNE